MSITCLQQGVLPKLAPKSNALPDKPFLTLTELVSYVVWGAPLTPGEKGTLRRKIYEEEATHRRKPRNARETQEISDATARFYRLLSHAVVRGHIDVYGLKQVGDQYPGVEAERIEPNYLLTARHHDLLDNVLHEEAARDEQEMLHRIFDRAARERRPRLVQYLDVKLPVDDAAFLINQYQACKGRSVADRPSVDPKVRRTGKWPSLHVAIAWVVTRDAKFCAHIAEDVSASQLTFCATAQLEREAIEAGCFKVVEETMHLGSPTSAVKLPIHRLTPDYKGRFGRLATDYDLRGRRDFTESIAQVPHAPESAGNRITLGDYLLGRWHESFNELKVLIADGALQARGVALDGNIRNPAGEMPASCVSGSMWMDVHGVIWEGPRPVRSSDAMPRRWVEVSVNRDELIACFPPISLEDPPSPHFTGGMGIEKANKGAPGARTKCVVVRQVHASGGHPREYHRETFDALLDGLFEENGALGSDCPEWNSGGKVVESLSAAYQAKYREAKVPGLTWLKDHVRRYLAKNPGKDGRKPVRDRS